MKIMSILNVLKNLLSLSVFLVTFVSANPNFVIATNIRFDNQGQLIYPDLIFMAEATKAHLKGFNQSAFSYFKKSAAFGNAKSQRYIGLMYVNGLGVTQDMIKGYVWLKLAALDNSPKNIELKNKVFNLLSDEEIKLAQVEYGLVSEDYGTIASLTRRDRWVTKQKWKMLGSHAGSLAFAFGYDSPTVQAFVENFKFGKVISGKIIPIEESSEEKKQ